MGKNKARVKKNQNVFQVANKQGKSKNKAKRVKTSLKQVSTLPFCLDAVLKIDA